MAAIALGAAVAVAATAAPAAALTITPTDDPEVIAQTVVADPTTFAGAEFTTQPLDPEIFPDPPAATTAAVLTPDATHPTFAGFPLSGPDFGLLTSGDPELLLNDPAIPDTIEYNDEEDSGKALEDSEGLATLRGTSVHDATTLKIDVQVPAGRNCLALSYRFLSDEFPEFVGSQYNDAFIAELDKTTWFANDANEIVAPDDFATRAGGRPVSVNGVGPTAVSNVEAAGTTFDAATGLVTSKIPTTAGAHSVYLSIFDQSDHRYDSVVMLDRLAFITEDPSTCKPPEVPVIPPPPPPPPGPPAPPAPPVNDITVPGGSVTFSNGAVTVTITVPGPGTLTAAQAPAALASRTAVAAAKKKKLIKPAKKIVTKAGKVKLKIKLTKKGKKQLRKKGKLKVRVAITFTPTGGSPNTEVAKLTIKKKKAKKKN
jgi:hypothetical protein